jgi:hypothetical protein
MAVKRGGDAPDPAFAGAEFGLLFGCVLVETVWRVRDYSVKTVIFLLFQPVETVGMKERCPTETGWFLPFLRVWELLLNASESPCLNGVQTAALADKAFGRIQSEIRPNGGCGRGSHHLTDSLLYLLDRKRPRG